ncbi:hypothetical protein P8452_06893 [Trifolium repens]|nr:hypothetical protein P8452_06893 [Trifolium repens]
MSATALLQKASQIGSTTSNINNNALQYIYDNNNNLGQFHNVEENKKMSQQSLGNLCFGGSDKLTLDFLGVGGMVRNMSNSTSGGGGGFSQRDQQLHSMSAVNNMDPKMESTQGNQPF